LNINSNNNENQYYKLGTVCAGKGNITEWERVKEGEEGIGYG
jgi:hypothetical protein